MSDLGDIKLRIEAEMGDTLDQLLELEKSLRAAVEAPPTDDIIRSFQGIADMAERSAKEVSGAYDDVRIVPPDVAGVIDTFNQLNDAANASAKEMADSF